jgi:hypothetical protein
MAAHLSASVNRPTVIIANGVNYTRFTEYTMAGVDNVVTVYPDVFNRKRKNTGWVSYNYPDAVSADIASIKASVVFDKLQTVLRLDDASSERARSRISPPFVDVRGATIDQLNSFEVTTRGSAELP